MATCRKAGGMGRARRAEWLKLCLERNLERERGALARAGALAPDAPVVPFDDALADVEAQSRAGVGLLHRVVHLAEGLEEARDVFGLHADARVGDAHARHPGPGLRDLDEDAAARGRELERVVEQVV